MIFFIPKFVSIPLVLSIISFLRIQLSPTKIEIIKYYLCHNIIHFNIIFSLFADEECVNRVKQLYEDLGLPHTYSLYEEESYNLIKTHIQQTSRGVPHSIFFKIMDKIYRRESVSIYFYKLVNK